MYSQIPVRKFVFVSVFALFLQPKLIFVLYFPIFNNPVGHRVAMSVCLYSIIVVIVKKDKESGVLGRGIGRLTVGLKHTLGTGLHLWGGAHQTFLKTQFN